MDTANIAIRMEIKRIDHFRQSNIYRDGLAEEEKARKVAEARRQNVRERATKHAME